MNKCIVLGVDAPLSPATRQAMRALKDLFVPIAPRLVLLHVISIPAPTSPALGIYAGQLQSSTVTSEQRQEAEKVLASVRTSLQEQTLIPTCIEICIRLGSPAEEMSRLAGEIHADLVIVGSRGNTTGERIRRFFLGSKSRKVLQLAPCPVLIVSPPPARGPGDLVTWYKEAITRYLHEDPDGLTVLTPCDVVQIFAPPNGRRRSKHREQIAAKQALEDLAGRGMLCRHEVQGQLRYVND